VVLLEYTCAATKEKYGKIQSDECISVLRFENEIVKYQADGPPRRSIRLSCMYCVYIDMYARMYIHNYVCMYVYRYVCT
jgi:hypothetical protein